MSKNTWIFTFAGNEKETGFLVTKTIKASGRNQAEANHQALLQATEILDDPRTIEQPCRIIPTKKR